MFSIINNQTFCVQRDSSLNYLTLVSKRKASSIFCQQSCGSESVIDYSVCLDASKTCPINGLLTSNTSRLGTPLQGGWSASLVRNASTGSPISKLWLALSQPCGNLEQDFV